MSKTQVLGIAFVLSLAALPFISMGTIRGIPALWWTGLVFLFLAAVAAPITRYALADDQSQEDSGDQKDAQDGDGHEGGFRVRQ